MTEASLHFSSGEGEKISRSAEFRDTPLRPDESAVMAAPKSKKKQSQILSSTRKKAELEDNLEERMQASIETRFSSFEEEMLNMFAEFQRQSGTSVSASKCSTLGVCEKPTMTGVYTFGTSSGQRNIIPLENSLTEELLGSRTRFSANSDNEGDVLSLQPGQGECRDMSLISPSQASEVQICEERTSERFKKYNLEENLSEETCQVLLDMFGEDACIKKSDAGAGILLDKTQIDILNESWRVSVPFKLTAYREAYKGSFPVHEKAGDVESAQLG